MSNARLSVESLEVRYNDTLVVDNLSFSVAAETLVLFGPSGCGKTTVLKAILGVHEPSMKMGGAIRVEEAAHSQTLIGMLFQGSVLPNWLRVEDLCRLGSRIRRLSEAEQEKRVDSVLTRFGVAHLRRSFGSDLSGGERQRVALAVTLCNRPDVLLLDEPTSSVDGAARTEVWRYIEHEVRSMRIPTVLVTHDPVEAVMLGDVVLLLEKPAHIVKSVSIPLPHPRSIQSFRDGDFWHYRDMIDQANA
ncbi:MAG: ATP-binding cassette domain-containing protein [Thermoanaerobaculia bacterium]